LLSWAQDSTLRLWDEQSGALLATLHGHAGAVLGTLALADGRLLSWAEDDDTLRLWDQSGALLATMDGHTGGVRDALALADGRLLAWAEDGTMCLWASQSSALLEVVAEKDAARLHPDWLAAWAASYSHSLVQCGFIGWQKERVVSISSQLPNVGYAALWHADANTTARHLLLDGTFVVTLDSGQVCFLKLYYGNQRIDLHELRQLVLPSNAT
jgi:WD40 repeat protein